MWAPFPLKRRKDGEACFGASLIPARTAEGYNTITHHQVPTVKPEVGPVLHRCSTGDEWIHIFAQELAAWLLIVK